MDLRRGRWARTALLGGALAGVVVSLAYGDDLARFLKRAAKAKTEKSQKADAASSGRHRSSRKAAPPSAETPAAGPVAVEGAPASSPALEDPSAPARWPPAAAPASAPAPSPRGATTIQQLKANAAAASARAPARAPAPATPGVSSQAPVPLEPIAGARPGDQRAILALSVNLVDKGEVYVVLRQRDVLVGVEDLNGAGVHDFTGLRESIGGKLYVSLQSLAAAGITYAFDERALTLAITVPAAGLGVSVIDLATHRPPNTIEADEPSAFANYALRLDNLQDFRAFGELGATFKNWLLYTQVSSQPSGHVVRGLSYLTYSVRPRMQRWIAGDTFAASGLLGGAVFLGGMSVVRDFGLDPYFYRFPSLGLQGATTTPSTVSVYVNNTLVRREDISPGQFQVNNLPLPLGAGNARVVVRDAFGREQTLATPFYFSTGVLRPGLSDYGFHAGFVRNNIANESWDYSPPVLMGRYRLGFNDWLTAGARAEATTHLGNGGANATVRTLLGDVEGAVAGSGGEGANGAAAQLSYTYLGQSLSAGAVGRLMSDHYANVTLMPFNDRATRQADMFAGASLSPRVSLTGRFGAAQFRDAGTSFQTGLLGSLAFAPGVNLFLTANRTDAQSATHPIYDAFATLSVALPDRITASAFVESHDGHAGGGAEVQRSLPIGPGYGYRLRGFVSDVPGTSSVTANAVAQGEYGRYEAEYDRIGQKDYSMMTVSGGLVALGGNVFATRPVQQSYGLIQVPGAPGVRGYLNNHEIGRTDRNGNLLVPELIPYYSNRLGIADDDLPMDFKVEEIEKVLSTPLRGGGVARFDARRVQTVTGSVAMDLGQTTVSPAFGQLTVHVGPVVFTSPLGRQGEFYFDDLRAGTFEAEVDSAVGTCRFKLDVPKTDKPFIDAGRVKCVGTPAPGQPAAETPGVITPLPSAPLDPAPIGDPPAAAAAVDAAKAPVAKTKGRKGGAR